MLDEAMMDEALSHVRLSPEELAKRQTARWPGLSGEIIRIGRCESYEYRATSHRHLLVVHDRVVRSDGETRIEGLPPSTQHDLSGKMCVVPAGREFSGWDIPRGLSSTSYFYIDPARLPADSDPGASQLDVTPRLLFQDAALWSTIRKLQRLIEEPRSGSRLYAEGLVAVLAVELAQLEDRAAPQPAPSRGGLAGWQLRIVCERIEEELSEEVSLQQLARSVRLSPWHFCRAFKQSMGVAPHRFQLQRRVERAKMMLADHRRSVTDVALSCGFGGSSYFASTFRKLTGRTPTNYRRSLL